MSTGTRISIKQHIINIDTNTGVISAISKATGVLKVASLLPNTPAYKAGLDAEDEKK